MKNVFIFHGVGGHARENWFPWLKNRVEGLGYRVEVPEFPTPEGQILENWLKVLENYKDYLNEETILIGHSLGVPFTLNVLERYQAKAAFLVAGFVGKIGHEFDENMKTFAQRDFNWNKIKQNCKNFTVFHSDNDPYVPLEKGRELAKKLDTEVILVSSAGHFNEAAGYTEFPELLEKVREIL